MPKKSKVERLPAALRKKLLAMLADPAMTQAAIADAINASAHANGAQAPVVSKSGVNRYAQKMARFAEKNRQARQVAEAYLEHAGDDTRGQLGRVVNEQIRLMAFDLIGEIEDQREGGKAIDVKLLSDLIQKVARGLKDLEQADQVNAARSREVRLAALEDAACAAESVARADGLTAATIEKIKADILGLQQ